MLTTRLTARGNKISVEAIRRQGRNTDTSDIFGLTIKYTKSMLMLGYILDVSNFGKRDKQTDKLSGPPVAFAGRPFLARTKLQR